MAIKTDKRKLGAKRRLMIAALLCISLMAYIGFSYGDVLWRHFGYGFSHEIKICLFVDDKAVATSKYDVSVFYLEKQAQLQKSGYYHTLAGGYGLYGFTLRWGDKTAHFALENVNDWWRTDILLFARSDRQEIERMDYIFNNNPPIIEQETLKWEAAP